MWIRIAIGLVAAACASNASAGDRVEPTWYRVNVHVHSAVAVPAPLLWQSEEGASNILAKTGVQLTWRVKRPPLAVNGVAECGSQPATRNLSMEFIAEAPRNFTYTALAMAMPLGDSGVRIVIFYDRVSILLREHRSHQVTILSYVLAHEVMHILQGVAHHSQTGLMRARWTARDFAEMYNWGLNFTPEDVQLIPRALAAANCS
jgi:hypothetical protein